MENYFDMLGQNVPNEEKKEESQEMVNLTVRADAECAVFCDGDFLFTLEAGKLEKTQAPAGQHLLEFKSLEDDNIVVEKEVDFSDVKKNYLVIVREFADIFASKKAKAAEEKAAKEAEAEARRKAKEAAEAEARRKALTDGLVIYFPFNGNANDESGKGNHGTPSNVVLTTGVKGDADGAYQFGGIDNPGCIYVPNSESLQFTDGTTFSAYVKPTSWTNMNPYGNKIEFDGVHCIFAKDHDRTGVAFFLRGNNENIDIFTSLGDVSCQTSGCFLNKWTHVAFVYGKGYARLYVNGQLVDEKEGTPNFSRMNGRNLYIGKFSDFWYPFSGLIDEVRIYNRALTGQEVRVLYEESMK